jgi:hypothetical protein
MFMSSPLRGAAAGLIASLALAGIFLFKSTYGVLPEVNIFRLLVNLGGGTLSSESAWADHFIVGTLIYGLLFGVAEPLIPRPAAWLQGIIFGIGAWLLMMVTFMPLAGSGLFGIKVGTVVPIGMLILHLIFGAVLGLSYSVLTLLFPERPPETA